MRCYGDEDVRMNYDYLDTLDFSRYLKEGRHSLSEVMMKIEDDYENNADLPQFLQGCVFNFLSREEVAHYLCDRYDLVFMEVVEYDYYKELEDF